MPPLRARDLGVPFDGEPGPLNAITDVAGLTVGQVSRLDDQGARCGVTAIFPLGAQAAGGVHAGLFAFNGTGELTGGHQIREIGAFFGPVLLTGSTSVGTVSEACLRWVGRRYQDEDQRFARMLPVVGETWDGNLNDSWGFHLRPEDVWQALDSAQGGPVAEGNVGGGTAMVCHAFKGGTGTSSRLATVGERTYRVGVLVQANHGRREDLLIGGLPAGRLIQGFAPEPPGTTPVDGSILAIIATDAPLDSAQLERLARRATVGLARTGGFGGALSGDIFLAFSTAQEVLLNGPQPLPSIRLPGENLDPLFLATAWATEEAIVNALVAARTMDSVDGLRIHALPHEPLAALMRRRMEMLS